MARSKRKVGEKPKVRQPLKIDKLPVEMRDRIQAERSAGRTWAEIEEMSPAFEWAKVPEDVTALFPGKRLPQTNLQRWYDLRVSQVQKEVMKQSETARALAMAFAGRELRELPEAVLNALRDTIFSLLETSDEKSKGRTIKALSDLGWLVNDYRKVEIKARKQTTEEKSLELKIKEARRKFDKETNDAAKKLGKGKPITEDDINRIRERTFGLPPVQRSAAGGTAN